MVESELVKEYRGNSVESVESVDRDHEHEPEPHGEVHLFVDDVLKDGNDDEIAIVLDRTQYLGEDTQTIVSLLVSGRAHIRDITGDFRRKHCAQRVPAREGTLVAVQS